MNPAFLASIFWMCSGATAGFLGSICTCSLLKSYGCFCGENGVRFSIFIIAASMALSIIIAAWLLGKLRKSHL